MEITKEAIELRLKELNKQKEQMIANTIAIDGAIQDCKQWMLVLEQGEHDGH